MFVVRHSLFDDYTRPYLPSTVDILMVKLVLAVKATHFYAVRRLLIVLH